MTLIAIYFTYFQYQNITANNMNFNLTLMMWVPPSCKRTMCHVTETAGIKAFLIPKKESALVGTNRLVKDRSRKSGSIPERFLNKLASGNTGELFFVFGCLPML